MGGTFNRKLRNARPPSKLDGGPHRYACKYCGKILWRESDKLWIPSWCDSHKREVRITRVDKPNETGE